MKLHADHLIDRMTKGGVLLTTKSADKINTMTIGWGSIGCYWAKNIFIVPVRRSRYTKQLIDNTDEFTVSVPKYTELAKQIAYCGTHSGSDTDKIADAGLSVSSAKSVDTPIIAEGYLHYECRIVARQEIDDTHFVSQIGDKWYDESHGLADYHTLYYGEIVECYITDDE